MILIIGATSSIGKAVIPMLLEQGHSVRLTSRTPEKLSEFADPNVEILKADLNDTDSIRKACTGVDTVVSAVANMLGRGKNSSKNVDYLGHRQLIDICSEIGIKKFVYLSALEATHDNPVAFFRYKALTEDYLRASKLNYTILRSAAFFEPHLGWIGEDILKGGKGMIMGNGDNPRNFISNQDVARFVVLAISDPKTNCQTIEIGGLDNFTNKQVAEIYAKAAGVELKLQQVPRFVPNLMSKIFKVFHPGVSDVLTAIVDADTRNKTFDVTPTLKQYPLQLTRLEDWVQSQVKTS
jgi:uncharacterized protein YbjT (DUF2867 family)